MCRHSHRSSPNATVKDLHPCSSRWARETGVRSTAPMRYSTPWGPALFSMPLLPVLKRTREEFEPKGVEAYLDDVSIVMVEVTSDTVDVVPFLQRELASIGIAMNPSKMVSLASEGARADTGRNCPA